MNATATAKCAPQQRAANRLLERARNPLLRQPGAAGTDHGDPWVEAELLGQDAFFSGLSRQNPFAEGPDNIALSLRHRWAAGWVTAEDEFWRAWRFRPQGLNDFDAWAKKHYPKVGERLQRERKTAAVKTRRVGACAARPADRKTSQKPAEGMTLAG
jgi:hypothetical protein